MLFDSPLRVAINAQLREDSGTGGILTVLKCLAALPKLKSNSERYAFITPSSEPDWLRRFLPKRALTISAPSIETETSCSDIFQDRPWHRPRAMMAPPENFYDALDADVIHFPFQIYAPCTVPTIFNPHDLQHHHFPQFFSPEEFDRRDALYRYACSAANTVVVASPFVRDDLVLLYALDPAKIQIIAWAPPPLVSANDLPDLRRVTAQYGLPALPFALYPAMTWEHKNHLRLIEAMALQRQRNNASLALICTGHKTEHWPTIEKRIAELGLSDIVCFPGLVPDAVLARLYRSAMFTIIPTLFEAASGPLYESWQHGAPAACAAVTSLPEQADDAALMFDPLSTDAIASALDMMANNAGLREDLRRRGSLRLAAFSLDRTAKAYRAVYRRAAGRRLTREDRRLLDQNSG